MEGKASKIEEEELLVRLKDLEDRIKIMMEPKIESKIEPKIKVPPLSVRGEWYDDITQAMKKMGPDTKAMESLEIKTDVKYNNNSE